MRTRAAAFVLAAVALTGCGVVTPEKPQILIDRSDAGIQFGDVARDTRSEQALSIENGGYDDLVISKIETAGAGEFTISGPTPPGDAGSNAALVPLKKHTFLKVVFYPRAYKDFAGTITITSNAANNPKLVVPISGRGIDAGL